MTHIRHILFAIIIICNIAASVYAAPITRSAPRLTVVISIDGLDNYEIEFIEGRVT